MVNIIRQFIVFCGVGAVNTALSLLIILFLSEMLHVHYVIANIIGYAAGLTSGFLMHKNITFRTQHSESAFKKQFSSFLIVFGVGYTAQLLLLMMLVEHLHLPNMPSQIIAWGLYVIVSFAGNKYFTFYGGKP
jgi:putative flippase GtrA